MSSTEYLMHCVQGMASSSEGAAEIPLLRFHCMVRFV